MKLRALLRPWLWVRVLASGNALVVAAIQLSEVADEFGHPNLEQAADFANRATLVAFEAYRIRKTLNVV